MIGAPVVGCCQVRRLNSRRALCSSPLAGGAASSGPMMAKRNLAQRSRSLGSYESVIPQSHPCGKTLAASVRPRLQGFADRGDHHLLREGFEHLAFLTPLEQWLR